MSVALEIEKSSPRCRSMAAGSISVSADSDRTTTTIWPIEGAEDHWTHHLALVETAWGMAGVRWRLRSEARPFVDDGAREALLMRIIPPGMPPRELRAVLAKDGAGATEIFADAHGHFHPQTVPHWFGELRDHLVNSYVGGWRHGPIEGVASLDLLWRIWHPRLDPAAITPFQARVLEVVAGIPRGRTRTYGQIAELLGSPRAARAVGTALAANPWPVLIPCHRVIGSTGALTGFTAPGGVRAKRRMLLLEEALRQTDEPLFED